MPHSTPVSDSIREVLAFFDAHGLDYRLIQHPPLFTIEEGLSFWNSLDDLRECTHCKNLFLRNHSGKRHYLVTMECHRTLDFPQLQSIIHEGKLSFASEERMMRCLGLRPGSVSPLGLIHDMTPLADSSPRELFPNGHRVKYFIDRDLYHAPYMTFHPCDNTASMVLSHEVFHRFLGIWGGDVEWLDFDNHI